MTSTDAINRSIKLNRPANVEGGKNWRALCKELLALSNWHGSEGSVRKFAGVTEDGQEWQVAVFGCDREGIISHIIGEN